MQIIRHQSITAPIAATVGNFDGFHIGHQTILQQLTQAAHQLHVPTAIINFEPTPQEYFNADKAPARLMNLREKIDFLNKTSIDYLCLLNFNQALSSLPAEKFVTDILHKQLNIHYLLIGDDFHFGKNREGNIHLLKQYETSSFRVEAIGTQLMQDERISSTRIRTALADSNFELVSHLLGRPYTMVGKVITGQQRGRTIGFPTANIDIKRLNSPLRGVFAIKAFGLSNPINGVANLGVRPTVDGTRCLLEVHLFDFNQDIYGQQLEIQFCHKIRDEKKFASFDELKNQIAMDVKAAKEYFR